MTKRNNKRRHDRIPAGAAITLSWRETSGEAHFVSGKVLDFSDRGLRVELSEPIKPHSYVILGAPGQNRAGWAGWVRHCAPRAARYVVGLELSAGARWMDLPDTKLPHTAVYSFKGFRPHPG